MMLQIGGGSRHLPIRETDSSVYRDTPHPTSYV